MSDLGAAHWGPGTLEPAGPEESGVAAVMTVTVLCVCAVERKEESCLPVWVEPSHACFIPVHGVHLLIGCQWEHCACVEFLATNQDSLMSFIFTTASKINLGIQKCFPLIRNSKRRQAVISDWSTAPGFSGFLVWFRTIPFSIQKCFPLRNNLLTTLRKWKLIFNVCKIPKMCLIKYLKSACFVRGGGFSTLCKLTDLNLIGPHEEILSCTSDYLNVVDEEGKAHESVVTTHGHTVTDLARLQTQGVQLQSWWSKPSLLCLRLNQKGLCLCVAPHPKQDRCC